MKLLLDENLSLAELLEGMEAGDTLPIDQTFENAPPVGNEVL